MLASPARRCQETVAPLARLRGREVEVEAALAEGAGLAALDCARGAGAGAVLCTHGPVLHDVLAALARQDVPGVHARAEVASAWILELEGDRVVAARNLRPE